MYSISLALTLASSWLALTALARPRWRYWGAYVAVSWLALHTHYYAVFILVAQNLFVAFAGWRDITQRRWLPHWLAAQIILWGLYLPWLAVARGTLTGYGGAGDSPAFGPMLRRALSAFLAGDVLHAGEQTPLAILIGLLGLVGALRLMAAGARGRRALLCLLLYGGLPVIGTWLSAQSRPIFNERYLVAAAPAYYLLLAASLALPVMTEDAPGGPQSLRWDPRNRGPRWGHDERRGRPGHLAARRWSTTEAVLRGARSQQAGGLAATGRNPGAACDRPASGAPAHDSKLSRSRALVLLPRPGVTLGAAAHTPRSAPH